MSKSRSIGSLYAELSIKDQMTHGLGKAEKSLKAFGSASAKYAAAGAAVMAAAMVVGTKRTLDQIDALSDLSASTGLAVSDLMGLGQAYKEGGMSAEQVAKDIGKMQKALDGANQGMTAQQEIFQRLNLDVKELMQLSPAEQFEKIGKAIMGVQNMTERVSLSRGVFGKGGAGLLAVFENVEEARRSLGKMPAVAQEFADEMGRANDLIGRMPNKFDQFFTGFTAGIVGELVPALEKIDGLDFTDAGEALGKDIAPKVREIADAMASIDYVGIAQNIAGITAVTVDAAAAIANLTGKLVDLFAMTPQGMVAEMLFGNLYSGDLMPQQMMEADAKMAARVAEVNGKEKPKTFEQLATESWQKESGEGMGKEGGFAAYMARIEERQAEINAMLENGVKQGVPEMLRPNVLDLTTPFTPDMLLTGGTAKTDESAFKQTRSFDAENQTDEYIKRGLSFGATTNASERMVEKQTKFLEEIRDAVKKPRQMRTPATF